MNHLVFHYRELTRTEGLWVSIPHQVPHGAAGEVQIRQGVIGGHVGSPRCAIAENGFFYGLGADGRQIDRLKAYEIGLIKEDDLDREEACNEELIEEVRFCGSPQFESAIKACDVKLKTFPSKTEVDVLARMRTWHDQVIPDVSRALLFGSAFSRMRKNELAALIKLVRRRFIRVYRSCGEGGYMLRFNVREWRQWS